MLVRIPSPVSPADGAATGELVLARPPPMEARDAEAVPIGD